MNHLDLFTGIGGFALAAEWVWGSEYNPVAFCEMDEYCQKVLRKRWPNVPIITDVRECDYETVVAYTKHSGHNITEDGPATQQDSNQPEDGVLERDGRDARIDLITGGFPCEPFSFAGQRQGFADNRHLWPEMYRVVREVQPTWVVIENVVGFINMALDIVLAELESADFSCQTYVLPACAIDAPHRRDRVWVVAHSNQKRCQVQRLCDPARKREEDVEVAGGCEDVPHGIQPGLEGYTGDGTGRGKPGWIGAEKDGSIGKVGLPGRAIWEPEPSVGRVVDGVPSRVDRLKCLGNAVVPQLVAVIFMMIKGVGDGMD